MIEFDWNHAFQVMMNSLRGKEKEEENDKLNRIKQCDKIRNFIGSCQNEFQTSRLWRCPEPSTFSLPDCQYVSSIGMAF